MSNTILWIDDDYNRYKELVASLEKKDISFEFAATLVEAREKLKEIQKYDAIIVDIIMREGRGYSVEDAEQPMLDYPYWGLVALKEIHRLDKCVPKIIVLTIVGDVRVLSEIREMKAKKGLIHDVLRKGILKQEDVHESVCGALNIPL